MRDASVWLSIEPANRDNLLAFIRAIQSDALEAAAKVCESGGEQLLTGTTHIVERGFREHFAGLVRALIPKATP